MKTKHQGESCDCRDGSGVGYSVKRGSGDHDASEGNDGNDDGNRLHERFSFNFEDKFHCNDVVVDC